MHAEYLHKTQRNKMNQSNNWVPIWWKYKEIRHS